MTGLVVVAGAMTLTAVAVVAVTLWDRHVTTRRARRARIAAQAARLTPSIPPAATRCPLCQFVRETPLHVRHVWSQQVGGHDVTKFEL